jgi:urease accessory protein
VTGAAIRLGRLGHVQAQRLLAQARPRIAAVLAQAPPALDDIWNGAPALEIAAMRHETRSARLFAN